jgi:hypothetical protein
MVNGLLKRGDKIALAVPTFTPYLEIAHLDKYAFETVEIDAGGTYESGAHSWQYPDSEIDKLLDPTIKAFFVVNPSDPLSYAIQRSTLKRIANIVNEKRKDLIIITDDVYGTFVEGFESLMKYAPRNTITVYSYSKYFGCTGWRLGVIAIHQDNVFEEMIAALPEPERIRLRKRYSPLTLTPGSIKFIDRLVADSRQVALNHTILHRCYRRPRSRCSRFCSHSRFRWHSAVTTLAVERSCGKPTQSARPIFVRSCSTIQPLRMCARTCAPVAQRIAYANAEAQPDQRRLADQHSTAIQATLWKLAMQNANHDQHSTMIPLFIAALNDTINLSSEERDVLSTHIPDIVIVWLLLIAFIASATMGYGFGRQGKRAVISKVLFAVMVAIVVGLVLDLDRPQRGIIRVNLAPLQTVQQTMEAP